MKLSLLSFMQAAITMYDQPIYSQDQPLVAGHRGAPAYYPEHTIASYVKAIELGVDIIEPDLVITKDKVLVVRHEPEISGTTNVASLPQFAHLQTTKNLDGTNLTGWWVEDFTLKELKELRAVERIPATRPNNTRFDGLYEIPTFQEVIDLAKAKSIETGRTIAICTTGRCLRLDPETKHPSFFKLQGITDFDDLVVETLHRNELNYKGAPVFLQSFEVSNLQYLRNITPVTLVQLIDNSGGRPYDFVLAGEQETRTNDDLVTLKGLTSIAEYADVVAPSKNYIIPRNTDNNLGNATKLCQHAHQLGLKVHTFTFRPENYFLPTSLEGGDGADATAHGDSEAEIYAFLEAGLDGFFTDAGEYGRRAVDRFMANKKKKH
ncbi:hypothetical protein HDU91_000709 [Kappamyces sp. JEL0680]|nr:hypothetical protein HDU91_000709 [Kappamyces sp. JEL0680]